MYTLFALLNLDMGCSHCFLRVYTGTYKHTLAIPCAPRPPYNLTTISGVFGHYISRPHNIDILSVDRETFFFLREIQRFLSEVHVNDGRGLTKEDKTRQDSISKMQVESQDVTRFMNDLENIYI